MSKIEQKCKTGLRSFLVETGERFVGDQHLWIEEQAPNQSQPVAFSSGEGADVPLLGDIGESDLLEKFPEPGLIRSATTGASLIEREANVVAHRPCQHGRVLRYQSDSRPPARQLQS